MCQLLKRLLLKNGKAYSKPVASALTQQSAITYFKEGVYSLYRSLKDRNNIKNK